MDHQPGLLIATRRASRARLLRFFAAAPARRWWLGGRLVAASAMPTDSLRDAACADACHFWAVRRRDRAVRALDAAGRLPPLPLPPGGTVAPALQGVALDAWLAEPRTEHPTFAIAAE